MAILYAYEQTDLDSVNLNYWYGDDFAEDQLNEDSEGSDFQFDYHLRTVGNDILSLYGTDFVEGVSGFVDTGMLEDVVQWAADGEGGYDLRWEWEEWNISMVRFFDAGVTEGVEDDYALIESVLSGRDFFYLSMDNDQMRGFEGHDRMFGFGGNDKLEGDFGHDHLNGGSGNDLLIGGNGEDRLFGGEGRDKVRGGLDEDWLRGGGGRDVIIGGGGADMFNFRPDDDVDIIRDFSADSGDKIDLTYFELAITTQADFSGFVRDFVTRYGNDKGDSRIDFGDGDVLILRDVHKTDLEMDNFIF